MPPLPPLLGLLLPRPPSSAPEGAPARLLSLVPAPLLDMLGSVLAAQAAARLAMTLRLRRSGWYMRMPRARCSRGRESCVPPQARASSKLAPWGGARGQREGRHSQSMAGKGAVKRMTGSWRAGG